MNIEKYKDFINEQKYFFEENIKKNFKWSWNDPEWAGGTVGSG